MRVAASASKRTLILPVTAAAPTREGTAAVFEGWPQPARSTADDAAGNWRKTITALALAGGAETARPLELCNLAKFGGF